MESRLSNPAGPNPCLTSRLTSCLTSIDCFGYLTSADHRLDVGEVQKHLDGCDRCRVLVAEAAHALFGNGGPTGAAPVRTLADAEILGGRYQIKRFIARGGMGEVYEAADQALGEMVALKTLSPAMLDQGDAAARLIAEVRLARKVVHPNVCRILEFGLHRHGEGREVTPFLTMELLEGETLASRVRRAGPLDPCAGQRVLEELSAGLHAVHKAGIVHRDFKTENVFLVQGPAGVPERAVVMDFGLAHALESQRAGGGSSMRALIGTVAYMAPEQFEGRRATPAFDIYALGIVAFEMMTGRLPFIADTPMAAAMLRLREDPPLSSTIRPELGPAWDAVIGRCLAREPGDRFGDATAIAEGLRQALLAPGAPTTAAATTPVEGADGPARARASGREPAEGGAGAKRRATAMVVGGLLLASLGFGVAAGLSFWTRHHPTPPAAPMGLPPHHASPRVPAAPPPPLSSLAEPAPTAPAPNPLRRPAAKRPRAPSRLPHLPRGSVPPPGVAAPAPVHHHEDPGAPEGDDDLINPFSRPR